MSVAGEYEVEFYIAGIKIIVYLFRLMCDEDIVVLVIEVSLEIIKVSA